MNIDFSTARFKHLNWRFRIKAFLDGKETLTQEQAISHEQCDLGKWFYTFGKLKYGHLSVIQEFEILHIELHRQIYAIVKAKADGKQDEAKKIYEQMLKTSDKLIACLDEAEKFFVLSA